MSGNLEEIARLVHQLAAEVGDDKRYESLTLAAHLFALSTHLQAIKGSGIALGKEPDYTRKGQVLQALQRLGPATAEDLYRHLIAALRVLDAEYRNPDRDADNVHRWTELRPMSSWPGFVGKVRSWHREGARWPELRRRRSLAVTRRHTYPRWPADRLQYLGMSWERYEDLPLEPIAPGQQLGWRLVTDSGQQLEESRFRVALCPLPRHCSPRFRVLPSGDRFTIDRDQPFLGGPALEAHLRELVLHDSARHDLQLLVMPELSVDAPRRALLQQLLATADTPLLGVIAGSFHIWRNSETAPFNESVILGSRPEPLWSHEKRGYFRLRKDQVLEGLEANPELFAPLSKALEEVLVEHIQAGESLRILDTSLGRMAVVICADAIDNQGGYRAALERAQPDFCFVVSMSPKSGDFHLAAEELNRRQISTFYVNASSACLDGSDLAFAYLALAQPSAAPPTRLRWCAGENRLQTGDPKGAYPPVWTPVGASVPGAFLLPEGRGLVINLGEHWSFSPQRK